MIVCAYPEFCSGFVVTLEVDAVAVEGIPPEYPCILSSLSQETGTGDKPCTVRAVHNIRDS